MTKYIVFILIVFNQFAFGQDSTKIIESTNKYTNSRLRIDTTEIIELTNNGKTLIVYGSFHKNNPENPMFVDIEERLLKLSPDIVLNEGGDWPLYRTKEESIINAEEEGFIKYLCVKNDIAIRTFEPTAQNEYEYILSKYKKSDVLLMYFCRRIARVQRKSNIEDFKNEMLNYLSSQKQKGFPIDNIEKEYNEILQHYKITFNKELDWRNFESKYVDPNRDFTILNKINRELSIYRDNQLLESIRDELNNKNKVFVIVGAGHVVVQKERIIQIFNEVTKKNET